MDRNIYLGPHNGGEINKWGIGFICYQKDAKQMKTYIHWLPHILGSQLQVTMSNNFPVLVQSNPVSLGLALVKHVEVQKGLKIPKQPESGAVSTVLRRFLLDSWKPSRCGACENQIHQMGTNGLVTP